MVEKQLFPLNDFQRQIFLICQQYPDMWAYNIPAAIEIKGEIDQKTLQDSIYIAQNQIPELKIRITSKNNEYLQFIGDKISIENKKTTLEDLNEKLSNESKIPIICEDSPLTRIIIWKIDKKHCVIQLTISHIIADRTSLSILINTIWTIYNNLATTKPINDPDAPRFLQSLSNTNVNTENNSYLQSLDSINITDYIPLDFSRAEGFDFHGDWVEGHVHNNLYNKVKEYCRKNKTRPYVFFASILSLLLHKVSNSKDICIASAISTRSLKYIQSFGPFVNTILMRQIFNENTTNHQELLQLMNNTVQNALDNSNTSFGSVISQLRKSQNIGEHTYQCMYVYNSNDFELFNNQNISMRLFLVNNKSTKCDLTLYMFDCGDKFKIKLEYATSIFKNETILVILDNLTKLTAKVIEDNQLLLDASINNSNSVIRHFETGDKVKLISNYLLLDKFEENFNKYNSNLAVVHKNKQYTYNDLRELRLGSQRFKIL